MSKHEITVGLDGKTGLLMAWLKGDELAWETGRNSYEAIGKVISRHTKTLEIKIVEKK